ncbi:hypothetical protein Pla175_32420 [Pirellulimonas nuda]|uniref:DUF1559 domain-containing protein n=1 Tax=Pirellulimonas nuda TaxID=2528009 RepID=A0A518DEF4_9BACT|nr:DUF1559 domain-containing protein [Pirellulimonas nuda]QDU89846.1 hypothetical protein Pla175_32420 [Pirellulimonas nuda]
MPNACCKQGTDAPLRGRAGFTLVELLTTVAIIGVLLGLLLPAVQGARESARRSQCQNQLRQLALATLNYESAVRSFPPGVRQEFFSAAPAYRGSSLFVHLLPYLEQSGVRQAWDFADPQNNAFGGDSALTATVLPVLVCPSEQIETNPISQQGWRYALASYGGNGGTRTYFPTSAACDGMFHLTGPASEPLPNQKPVRHREVVDGASRTLLLGERSRIDANFEAFAAAGWEQSLTTWGWWAPSGGRKAIGHVTLSAQGPINYQVPFSPGGSGSAASQADLGSRFASVRDQRLSAYGSGHPGGANFALADGSVQHLHQSAALGVLRALATRDADESPAGE